MTERTSIVTGAVIAAVVILVGGAFISLGARYDAVVTQGKLASRTRNAAAAVGPALGEPRDLAARLAQVPATATDLTARAETLSEDADVHGFVVGTDERAVNLGPGGLTEAALREVWSDARARPPRSDHVLGPYRAPGGAWVIVALAPAAGRPDAPSPRWVGTLVTVEQLLLAAGIATLPTEGYDYQLQLIGDRSAGRRAVAGSTETALTAAATEPIPALGPGWALTAAPRDTAVLPTVVEKGSLVAIVALTLGLVACDVSRRSRRLQAELATQAGRLRETERRLMDESQSRADVQRQFAHASFHDALTGLPNRPYFVDRVDDALGQLRRHPGGGVAVLVLTFDRLTSISDTFGHAAGDDLLVQAAGRLAASFQPAEAVLARVGHDEFGILLARLSGVDAAAAAAQRLQDALGKPFEVGRDTVFTSANVGIAYAQTGTTNAQELLREADIARSHAATQGRAQSVLFDPAVQAEAVTLQQLETDLHRALDREEFRLHFQPIVSLESGRIAGLETLIRWQHPLEGLVPPGQFIGVAEDAGLIVPINRWVFREACRQARAWRDGLPAGTDFYLSVNLSGHELREGDLCDHVETALREFDLPPGTIRIEMTESVLIENVSAANELVTGLQRIGVPLLLDDFGTGYSSLSYLNHFRVDYLKIDKAFVRRVKANSRNGSILRAIVHLARDLGIATIAEGIESGEDLAQLLDLGCDYGQGYYLARPLSADRAEAMLRDGKRWTNQSRSRKAVRRGTKRSKSRRAVA